MNIKKPIYIIEHLEPELFEWCLIEYEHISQTIGKESLWFTNIKNKDDIKKLQKFGKVFSESIRDFSEKLDFSKACVLDPAALEILETSDKEICDYFIFGGILGDYPPKKRTEPELTRFLSGASVRNIGKEQMSTDNAVYTVKQILDGRNFSDLKFQEGLNIEINEFETVALPYRYNLVERKPFVSEKLAEYLKNKETF